MTSYQASQEHSISNSSSTVFVAVVVFVLFVCCCFWGGGGGGGWGFFFSVATGLVLKFKLKYGSQYGGGAVAQNFSRELKQKVTKSTVHGLH